MTVNPNVSPPSERCGNALSSPLPSIRLSVVYSESEEDRRASHDYLPNDDATQSVDKAGTEEGWKEG